MGESILLNFTIGLFIGGIVGVMSMAIISARRITDMEQSVMELRAQRKLLKDEIVKLSTRRKPNPRRKRNALVRPSLSRHWFYPGGGSILDGWHNTGGANRIYPGSGPPGCILVEVIPGALSYPSH